jgi:hypothetical protein
MTVVWVIGPHVPRKITDVSKIVTAFIIKAIMEAISTSETSLNLYQNTLHNIPETCRFYNRHRENLKLNLT